MIAISFVKPKVALNLFTPGPSTRTQIGHTRANLLMGILEAGFAKSFCAGEGNKKLSRKVEEAIRTDGGGELFRKALDAPP
jgi:hypothetical protein